MYRKILITTDGSAVSSKTACAGVALAEQLGAEVLAVFVAPEYQYPIYVEIIPPSYPSEDEYRAAMLRAGREHTKDVVESCARRNVRCEALTTFSESAALKIVDVAESNACDLIFMGSHGRSGWGQLLLGSVTNKVLSHSRIPVLVHRLIKEPDHK
ncbi:nucleotide-binding universal stress UspA family protein [Duganella sp. 1411]|jgi:nucleotide-binding universal stress UspA family protein|uniref:universal stress protein n=1 Tax=Duganella sp. 1411 TaxID=2806572 RepID=UPI001AE32173|nr:universal stress protein [Duganella sp. 1411]MBP1204178.1 nucleotide-binding universal stress UspA family protein [Duganella sp. 1411]